MERETEKSVCYDEATMEAIRKWDEFITPIREFYGVKPHKKEVKQDELHDNQTC